MGYGQYSENSRGRIAHPKKETTGKRTRLVWPTDMVAHLWANRSQDEARNAGGNFYFRGATLYSYGSHFVIGHWLDDGRLLWNDAHYGSTTSGQQWTARAAVAKHHWKTAIHVPELDSNHVKKDAFAQLGKACMRAAMTNLEAAQKARQRRGAYIGKARGYLHSARELFLLSPQGKKAASTVPDVAPDADKATVAAVLQSVKRAEYLADAEKNLQCAQECHESACLAAARDVEVQRHYNATYSYGGQWNANGTRAESVMHAETAALRYLDLAGSFFKQAGKKSTAHANLARRVRAMVAQHQTQAAQDRNDGLMDHARILADEVRREWLKFRHIRKHDAQGNKFRPGRVAMHYAHELAELLHALPVNDSTQAFREIAGRVQRAQIADSFRQAFNLTREALADFRNTGNGLVYLSGLPKVSAEANSAGMPRLHEMGFALVAEVNTANIQWEAKAAERNAEKIAAWRSGEGVQLPRDVPTMARIKGANVETSRGAVVPLEHACRLARIARRVIAHGGKEWADGDGPRVGHFQVNRIGADSSALIGCHEFSAMEGARILAELESCEGCKGVHDETNDAQA